MRLIRIFGVFLLSAMVTVQASAADWTEIRTRFVKEANANIRDGEPTVDVGIYYASNYDDGFKKYAPLDGILKEFLVAKDIYAKVGMQLRLKWVKTGKVNPIYFSIQTNDLDKSFPHDGFLNMYEEYARRPEVLNQHSIDAFNAFVEREENNDKTLYLIAMQGVYMPYYESDEVGRVWTPTLVRTKGLSFPSYINGDNIPRHLRGVNTLSHHDFDRKKTVAHELGHKLMNVSHEYMEAGPAHEVFEDGGLMHYGMGTDIPSGKEGRWHKERLHLSPYVYRMKNGKKVWNPDYKGNGNYYDPIYGDRVIHFDGPRK